MPGALLQPQCCQTAPWEGWLRLSAYQQHHGTSNYPGWTNTCSWFCLTLFVQPSRLPTEQGCASPKQVKTRNRERSCRVGPTTPLCNTCWKITAASACTAAKQGRARHAPERRVFAGKGGKRAACLQSPAPGSSPTLVQGTWMFFAGLQHQHQKKPGLMGESL